MKRGYFITFTLTSILSLKGEEAPDTPSILSLKGEEALGTPSETANWS